MAHTFVHAGCDKNIARQVASEIEDIQILGEQGSGLMISVEYVESQTEYWREYFYQVECQRNQQLIEEINQSSVK